MKRAIKYNITIVLGAMICFLIHALAVHATDFQADVIQKIQGKDMKGKFFVKDKKYRLDLNMMGKRMSTITRMDKKVIWIVQHDNRMIIEMPAKTRSPQTFQFDEELKKIATKKKIGSEKMNGFDCDKYEIVYHDQKMGKATMWFSTKLNFPIKIVYHGPQGEMSTEYKNIKIGNVKDSLFEPPQGFQKMVMPAMGKSMGNMMPPQ